MNRLEITKDGSPTLYSEVFRQTYHSIHGALSESLHVFIKHGLEDVCQRKKKISILEMGFGAGLNAALTWQYAEMHSLDIRYVTIEKFPISEEVSAQFITKDPKLNAYLAQLNKAVWGLNHEFPHFTFQKVKADWVDIKRTHPIDLIYYDAFSPGAQPELWTEDLFKKMYDLLSPEGLLTTYCAQGQVKRNLKNAGFIVESPPGPLRKREMTVARVVR